MGISLVTFSGSTVTAQDDSLIYETAVKKSGIIYGCAVTIASSTVLHVAGGHGIIAGRKFTVDATDVSVALSDSGTLLGRLYIHLDLSNSVTPIKFLYETGAALTDPVQTANVNIVNGVYEFNLATFNVDTSTISNLVDVAPQCKATSKTLTAGSTTITFDVPTSGDHLINFFTSTGINYTEIDTTGTGEVTLTFEAQNSDVTVYCDIREV